MSRLSTFLCLIATSGCSVINGYDDPAVVGRWELEINVNTVMDIEVNGDGDAAIIITNPEGAAQRYDLEWEQRSEDEFVIDFICKEAPAGCDGRNFKMDCEASTSGEDLDCTARSGWMDPVFNWDLDE